MLVMMIMQTSGELSRVSGQSPVQLGRTIKYAKNECPFGTLLPLLYNYFRIGMTEEAADAR